MLNRMIKWMAAGALAVASVPAIALARHASLPTEGAITVTPIGLATPVAAKHVTARSGLKKKSAVRRKVQSKRHAAKRHSARRTGAHRATRRSASHRKTSHVRKHVPAKHVKSA